MGGSFMKVSVTLMIQINLPTLTAHLAIMEGLHAEQIWEGLDLVQSLQPGVDCEPYGHAQSRLLVGGLCEEAVEVLSNVASLQQFQSSGESEQIIKLACIHVPRGLWSDTDHAQIGKYAI